MQRALLGAALLMAVLWNFIGLDHYARRQMEQQLQSYVQWFEQQFKSYAMAGDTITIANAQVTARKVMGNTIIDVVNLNRVEDYPQEVPQVVYGGFEGANYLAGSITRDGRFRWTEKLPFYDATCEAITLHGKFCYTAGRTVNEGEVADYHLEKLSFATGKIIWRVDTGDDRIYGVQADDSGVYVGGVRYTPYGNWFVQKRSTEDGGVIWEATGKTGDFNQVNALAMAANVVYATTWYLDGLPNETQTETSTVRTFNKDDGAVQTVWTGPVYTNGTGNDPFDGRVSAVDIATDNPYKENPAVYVAAGAKLIKLGGWEYTIPDSNFMSPDYQAAKLVSVGADITGVYGAVQGRSTQVSVPPFLYITYTGYDVLKFDHFGESKWSAHYAGNSGEGNFDGPFALKLATGDIGLFVTGYRQASSIRSLLIQRLDPKTGEILWTKHREPISEGHALAVSRTMK